VTNATHRLLEEALTLGPNERAELAAELLASLDESATASDSRRELDVVNEWPKGFFEKVVGGWQGDPLERPEQGPAERRDRL